MKKLFVAFLLLNLFSHRLAASHLMGGEITWQCQSNGQFVFKMILYRDCGGIPMPTGTQNIDVYGFPGLTSIALNQDTIMDITYCQPAYNCYSANPPAGATEQGLYISNPITLNGVPPPPGWVFVWHSCCRNGALTNVNAAGFSLRAIMYPFNGQNANPCFDNSPAFAEKPKSILCSSKDFVYNHGAFDNDQDSLYYEWGIPLEEPANPPPSAWNPGFNPTYTLFNLPYTYSNPLPFNNPNIGATINQATGEINFTSFLSGNFLSNVKVTSYKCGVKVSEIYREIQFVILNCDSNNNPVITPPFPDTSGIFTLYADTVQAGDFVSFNLGSSDFDLDSAGNPQTIELSAYGSEFGTNFTDTAAGCLVPPCAIITTPMPAIGLQGTSIVFNWQTTFAHLGLFYPCAFLPNTYYFNFKATDSHCPAPAVNYKTVAITVLPIYPKPIVNYSNNTLSCMAIGFNYQWFLNRFQINGATSITYMPSEIGEYQVRITDSLGSGNYSDKVLVFTISGIYNQPSGLESLNLYPNPASEVLEVEFTENFIHDITLSLYDITGRCVFKKIIPGALGRITNEISLKEMNSGLYTFEIGNGVEAIRRKVVVVDKDE